MSNGLVAMGSFQWEVAQASVTVAQAAVTVGHKHSKRV